MLATVDLRWAGFCLPEPTRHIPEGLPLRGSGVALLLGKATVGSIGKPVFLPLHPPCHPRLSPPIPTGRMKAVSGGSWLEYLSIHCSSSRIGPSWKAVCSKESRADRPYYKQCHQTTRRHPFLLRGCPASLSFEDNSPKAESRNVCPARKLWGPGSQQATLGGSPHPRTLGTP